jgi:hypothetical protein
MAILNGLLTPEEQAYGAVMDDETEYLGEVLTSTGRLETHRFNGRRFTIPTDNSEQIGSFFPGMIVWID